MKENHLKMTEIPINSCQKVSKLKKKNFQLKNETADIIKWLAHYIKATHI